MIKKYSGHCWYIRARTAEFHNFLLWELAETKNLDEESRPNDTGRRISVFRVGELSLIYKIKERLDGCRINDRYYRAASEIIEIYVRRSPKGRLQLWPAPVRKQIRKKTTVSTVKKAR